MMAEIYLLFFALGFCAGYLLKSWKRPRMLMWWRKAQKINTKKWIHLPLNAKLKIAGVKYQSRQDGRIRHWGEWDGEYKYWKIISNSNNWSNILDAAAKQDCLKGLEP